MNGGPFRWLLPALLLANAPPPTAFERLRAMDVRVAIVSARLLAANVALCRTVHPDFGLMLQAIDQFPPSARPAARAAYGFEAPVSVALVVPGAAADRSGVRADDGLLAIDGRPLAPAAVPDDGPASVVTRNAVRAGLAGRPPDAPVRLTLVRDAVVRTVALTPPPTFAVAVELSTGRGQRAVADDRTILVGAALVARIDDAALAGVLAHELAHVVLEHRRRLIAAGVRRGLAADMGRSRRLIRRTEDEADRLSAWLLANAGFPIAAAVHFWRTDGAAIDGGVLRNRTHAGATTRARMIAAEGRTIAAIPTRPLRPALIDQRDRPLE